MKRERIYDADGFRTVFGDDRGWPGFTELMRDGRAYQARGTGIEVREVLTAEAARRMKVGAGVKR